MIAIKIALKNLKEFFREIKGRMIIFLMPIMFLAVFGLIFNKNTDTMEFPLAVVTDNNAQYQQLVAQMGNITNPRSGVKMFTVTEYTDLDSAKLSVKDGKNLIIVSARAPFGITITGDERNTFFNVGASVLTDLAGKFYQVKTDYVALESLNNVAGQTYTTYDLMVPGLIVYGLLIMIPYNAGLFAQISEKGEILRYFFSKARSRDIVAGYVISQSILSIFQVTLLFIVAVALGFKTDANFLEFLVIAIPTNLFVIGVGLFMGSWVKNSQMANSLAMVVSVILGFLSGSFIIGIEQLMKIGEFAGRTISFNQIFASTLAVQAWSGILLYDKHLSDLGFEIIGIIVTSLIVMVAGTIVYNNKQLKNLG